MTLTQILQKIKSAFYTKSETESKLSTKANDSDVVHKSGDETISGNKRFSGTSLYFNYANVDNIRIFADREGGNIRLIDSDNNYHYEFDTFTKNYLRLYCGNSSNDEITGFCFHSNGDFLPYYGSSQNIGSSSYKWKDVNTVLLNGKTPDLIEDQGDGYIRYSNGIQICWGEKATTTSTGTWTFPKTFKSVPFVLWQANGSDTNCFDVVGGGSRTTSNAVFIPFRDSAGSFAAYGVVGFAIGLWK